MGDAIGEMTRFGHGEVVAPDLEGRCGKCGHANFIYNNGHEFSASGVRGYRCVNCGSIKPEDWRETGNMYSPKKR